MPSRVSSSSTSSGARSRRALPTARSRSTSTACAASSARTDLLRAEALAIGVFGDQRIDAGEDALVATVVEVRVVAQPDRLDALLVERRPAPERERGLEIVGDVGGTALPERAAGRPMRDSKRFRSNSSASARSRYERPLVSIRSATKRTSRPTQAVARPMR
jgi:hypothetical protein